MQTTNADECVTPNPASTSRIASSAKPARNEAGDPLVEPLLVGLILTFIVLFMAPTYFAGAEVMRFAKSVPTINPIGTDLVSNAEICADILKNLSRPWNAIIISPLWLLVFGSLAKFPATTVRWIFALLAVVCLSVLSIGAPRWLYRQTRLRSASVLILVAGLFSYGLSFELERGQWNLPCLALCVAAVGLWHSSARYGKLGGAVLYVIATHFKVWPILFVICFVEPERGWKVNLKNLAIVELCNGAMLFILGVRGFLNFAHMFKRNILGFEYYWTGDHSIAAYVKLLDLHANTKQIGLAIHLLVAICALVILCSTFSAGESGKSPYVLLCATLLAMLIVKVSNDYKLVISTAMMAVFSGMYQRIPVRGLWKRSLETGALTGLSLCFFVTLYPGWQKGVVGLTQSNTPFLIGMLFFLSILALMRRMWATRAGFAESAVASVACSAHWTAVIGGRTR